ncbi:Hpy99I family type II restriction endonuclease [Candidatus Nomurabacteria bacterium]|nr:Hpy99I family type II restriction endonuclease [Candidatus Nomurabacteria bacterium]MCB9818441.1 Hpy99I family type II restriction endonuclease [Candidatus Nomurabacteria bacterium]
MNGDEDFLYAKHDISTSNGEFVGVHDVGLLKSSDGDSCTVFFITAWKDIVVPCSSVEIFDETKTGDGFSKKICNVCHKLKNTSDFEPNQTGVNNRVVRRPSCSYCRKHIDGKKMDKSDWKEWQKTKPNRVPFECPICGKRTIAGVTSKVVLEHDHKNGEIRGWVCDSCNTGLGRFKDDVGILNRAIRFISGS